MEIIKDSGEHQRSFSEHSDYKVGCMSCPLIMPLSFSHFDEFLSSFICQIFAADFKFALKRIFLFEIIHLEFHIGPNFIQLPIEFGLEFADLRHRCIIKLVHLFSKRAGPSS